MICVEFTSVSVQVWAEVFYSPDNSEVLHLSCTILLLMRLECPAGIGYRSSAAIILSLGEYGSESNPRCIRLQYKWTIKLGKCQHWC